MAWVRAQFELSLIVARQPHDQTLAGYRRDPQLVDPHPRRRPAASFRRLTCRSACSRPGRRLTRLLERSARANRTPRSLRRVDLLDVPGETGALTITSAAGDRASFQADVGKVLRFCAIWETRSRHEGTFVTRLC